MRKFKGILCCLFRRGVHWEWSWLTERLMKRRGYIILTLFVEKRYVFQRGQWSCQDGSTAEVRRWSWQPGREDSSRKCRDGLEKVQKHQLFCQPVFIGTWLFQGVYLRRIRKSERGGLECIRWTDERNTLYQALRKIVNALVSWWQRC